MNRKLVAFSFLASLMAFGSEASAASGTANATATIITPLAIEKSATATNGGDLAFGLIVPGTGGTVTVANNGARSTTGGAVAVSNSVYNHSTAVFNVTGTAQSQLTITLPANESVSIGNGSETMAVNDFVRDGSVGAFALDGSGEASFRVGATLTVAEDQDPGDYTGTFDVTVAYN